MIKKGLTDNPYESTHENSHHDKVAKKLAKEFTTYLNNWHKLNIDDDLQVNKELFKNYIHAFDNPFEIDPSHKDIPMFRASGVGGCKREHYHRLKGDFIDNYDKVKYTPPHQARWQRIGTRVGDMIQSDLLQAEKYYTTPEPALGEWTTSDVKPKPKFTFERINFGDKLPKPAKYKKPLIVPHFEEFSTVSKVFTHNDTTFRLQGSTDGILIYKDEFGATVRVLLEVKSKQTTYAQTGFKGLTKPNDSHLKQVIAYSLMFDIDYVLIIYVNCSKKAWTMSDEDLLKSPDIRVFGLYITDEMKDDLLEDLALTCVATKLNQPPKLDLDKWLFNEYKQVCATSLTEDELQEIKEYVESHPITKLNTAKKEVLNARRSTLQAIYNEILELRKELVDVTTSDKLQDL